MSLKKILLNLKQTDKPPSSKAFYVLDEFMEESLKKTDNKDVDAVRVDNQQVYKLIQIKCTVQVGMATGTRTESGLEIS